MGNNGDNAKGFEFKKFATPRIIGGIAIVVIVLWVLTIIFSSPGGPPPASSPDRPSPQSSAAHQSDSVAPSAHSETVGQSKKSLVKSPFTPVDFDKSHTTAAAEATEHTASADHETTTPDSSIAAEHDTDSQHTAAIQPTDASHGTDTHLTTDSHETAGAEEHGVSTHEKDSVQKTDHGPATKTTDRIAVHGTSTQTASAAPDHDTQTSGHGAASPEATKESTAIGHPLPEIATGTAAHKPTPKGVAFVEAAIKPMYYELEERWWGWRPNDIIDLTDNVNTFQLGVLEVTRRTTVALAERISRTGTTDAYDENLEQAMNWLMVKAGSYWFPSAESKYSDSLEELQIYLDKLKEGKATFYTRTDNLIPLLATFEDLLGSCDENLVKDVNEDGSELSFFSVDDYFYYTQGVASSMATILEAVHHDFLLTLESRNATELLHHAIVSCQKAAQIDPWIVLDRNLSSIFANHRANMAAPISHARFYLGQLIKTLST
jgi:hypothetical protein